MFGNESSSFNQQINPNISLGGIHFWGRFDFHMNFSIPLNTSMDVAEREVVQFQSGELSARFYPWRIQNNKFRPFLGVGTNLSNLGVFDGLGRVRDDLYFHPSILVGGSLKFREWQINLESYFLMNTKHNFYQNIAQETNVSLPNFHLSLGVRRYFDVTIHKESDKENGFTEKIFQQLKESKKLSSISLAIGPSAAFFIKAPAYPNQFGRESLPRHKSSYNWDIGLGYYWFRANSHIGLTYRNYSSNSNSYSFEEVIRRRSIALEAYKFFWDYNGFVPYIGVSISYETWATAEFVNNESQGTIRTETISPGIIFGWDIVASPLETWLLRTNLRYYPFQQINSIDGSKKRVDQFEFNFIQVVLYPNRFFKINKAIKLENRTK